MANNMMSMFDDLSAANIASYWMTRQQQEAPYLGEVLFPNTKQTSSHVEFYKGLTRAPKPLAPSALDAQAIVRDRQGFDKIGVDTGFFKEAKYLDENLRRELLNVAGSSDQARQDIILRRIFDDSSELLRGAALTREIARMGLLTAGGYTLAGNGQSYTVDYGMDAKHQAKASNANWKQTGSNPFDDIRQAIDTIGTDTGSTLTRAVMNRATFLALLSNDTVKSTLLANNANTAAVSLPSNVLTGYLQDEFGIAVQVYDKGYTDASGNFVHFIGDGMISFLPDGDLGQTVFSPTSEEVDLAYDSTASVSLVDTGVAVATYRRQDPVTVETKVSQAFVPTFEQIDSVYVLDAFHYTGTGSTISTSSSSTSSSTTSSSSGK